jgi:hypothetical protein
MCVNCPWAWTTNEMTSVLIKSIGLFCSWCQSRAAVCVTNDRATNATLQIWRACTVASIRGSGASTFLNAFSSTLWCWAGVICATLYVGRARAKTGSSCTGTASSWNTDTYTLNTTCCASIGVRAVRGIFKKEFSRWADSQHCNNKGLHI